MAATERPVARTRRRALRWLGYGAALLLLLPLAIAAAWLVSNLSDAAPQSRPPELALPTPRLAPSANRFFDLQAISAQADRRDLNAVGRAYWQAALERAALPASTSGTRATPAAALTRERAILGQALPSLEELPTLCTTSLGHCAPSWQDGIAALRQQHEQHGVIGRRCGALLDDAFAIDEALPPMIGSAAAAMPMSGGSVNCSRWLLGSAILAWQAGDKARTVERLAQADRLHRTQLAGSHTLISNAIAWANARSGLRVLSELALRDPLLAADLAPLVAPWPSMTDAARRWMVSEAAFQQGMNDEVSRGGLGGSLPILDGDHGGSGLGSVAPWLVGRRIGWHPQRNRQAIDAHWLRMHGAVVGGLPSAIAVLSTERDAMDQEGPWSALSWRNTLGHAVLGVGRPMYIEYLERQADVDLHREATAMAIAAQAARIAPSERARWAETQPLTPAARERLRWSDDGRSLQARTWYRAGNEADPKSARFAIRIVWPS
jgi:hypothetical protein